MGCTVSTDPNRLQAAARRHLWMHFTRLGAYEHSDVPDLHPRIGSPAL